MLLYARRHLDNFQKSIIEEVLIKDSTAGHRNLELLCAQ